MVRTFNSDSIYEGRFQVFSTVTLITGFLTGAFLAFAIPFLELDPKYICTDPTTNQEYFCTRNDFCGRPEISYRVDWSDDTSLHNWVEDLDLTCTPHVYIGLVGAAMFAGWAISAIFLPRMADVYGRKWVYLWSMAAHGTFYLLIILSKDLTLTTCLMFFFGMASVGRATVGYLYMAELVPLKNQTTVGTLLQFMVSVVAIAACAYFYCVSKHWLAL